MDDVRNRLLYMGGLAEEMVRLSMEVLSGRTREPLDGIWAREKEVNGLHLEIDEKCLTLIALHQPAAVDLRGLIAAARMTSDLERIADQAVNVAQNGEILLDLPDLPLRLLDLPRMADVARSMTKDALDAFSRKDAVLARSVVRRDDEEDRLKSQAFRDLVQVMQSDSSTIQRALGLILVARNLERIADHATNIAEEVIFMVLGRDIRHHAEEGKV
jgi:phosphate transport system protein